MSTLLTFLPKKYKWYHGVIFFAVLNVLTFAWLFDVSYYFVLNKPWFSPPTWVFGVVWPINIIQLVAAFLWVLNLPKTADRTKFLVVQWLIWLNYVVFQALSFGTKIPAMFFWPTFSMLALVISNIYFSHKLDKKIPWLFITTLIWLLLASTLGFYIWLNN